jgi:hypothetical protein
VGLFDTVVVGTRQGQVKCLGRGLRTLHVGDTVLLFRQVDADAQMRRLELAEPDAAPGVMAELAIGELSELRDFQVVMLTAAAGLSYVIVRDRVLVDWRDDPASDLPRIDNRGRAFDEGVGRPGVEVSED